MVSVKGTASKLEMEILGGVIEPNCPNIEFKNVTFDCKSIKDAAGHIFINQTYCNKSDTKEVKGDDYINREDALNAFSNAFYSGLAAKIKDIPSADVESVRHGRWDADMGGVWCSVCGEYSEGGEWDYCPYCGAKMDEEVED